VPIVYVQNYFAFFQFEEFCFYDDTLSQSNRSV